MNESRRPVIWRQSQNLIVTFQLTINIENKQQIYLKKFNQIYYEHTHIRNNQLKIIITIITRTPIHDHNSMY